MMRTTIKSLLYEDIKVSTIRDSKNAENLEKIVLHWKILAEDKDRDIEFILVKNAVYMHYLYKEIRNSVKIWEI